MWYGILCWGYVRSREGMRLNVRWTGEWKVPYVWAHWNRNKMVAILQSTFSNAFNVTWIKASYFIQISRKFIADGIFDNKSSFVQVKDWCRIGDKQLSLKKKDDHFPRLISLAHIRCTRPQCVQVQCDRNDVWEAAFIIGPFLYTSNRPVSQIPQCTCPISHNTPFIEKCAHFCSEWCIAGDGTGELWDLWILTIQRGSYFPTFTSIFI